MPLPREYLIYESRRFVVSFAGEPGKAESDEQKLHVTFESVTPGKPRGPETFEITDTVDRTKGYIKELLDREYGNGQWERVAFRLESEGEGIRGHACQILASHD
jgi:hypothetical protein